MPIITVKVSATPSAALTARLADGIVGITAGVLRKKPEITAVTVDYTPPEHWIVGGRSLKDHGKASFWLDIKVVDGTNLKDEKARYLHDLFAFMETVLGPLHEESYALVHEVPADAYGYGGRTQEHRYIAASLS
ncbi:4-oxalocrotonate tautomerase family protein [Azospirillum sp. TSO35-2]|uniref:tautomerase family protein n=1 Tax=Azospirillum sp. TSO35-2 TaxID=716796 RepID=UPI000D6212C1|nr:4-oxalocrotonate tautomerase family protein [Azospirillum sp. TSO35-2]PWC32743.1 4-oxalocrotonate tautomerase [Azospirillum sp. TSO35-2]